MAGWLTDGSPLISGALLSSSSLVPVDTNLTGGAAPQSGGMIPGTIIAAAAQLGLTALAGGAKAGATQLGYGLNTVTVVATDGNSVLLPYAYPGATAVVANLDAAQDIRVYGKGTDTINAVATATGNLQGEQLIGFYFGVSGSGDGTDAGTWIRVIPAVA